MSRPNATIDRLIDRLNELDQEDFFGTEGWRKFLLGDEECNLEGK